MSSQAVHWQPRQWPNLSLNLSYPSILHNNIRMSALSSWTNWQSNSIQHSVFSLCTNFWLDFTNRLRRWSQSNTWTFCSQPVGDNTLLLLLLLFRNAKLFKKMDVMGSFAVVYFIYRKKSRFAIEDLNQTILLWNSNVHQFRVLFWLILMFLSSYIKKVE